MKFTPLILVVVLLAGCTTHKDDARLQGTWALNLNATALVTSNLPPRVVWVTYSQGGEVVLNDEAQYGNRNVSFHYQVVEAGSNYIVIRTTAPVDKRRDIHIRFVNADRGYWIDTRPLGFGIQERFDKPQPQPLPHDLEGMGGLIPPSLIQLDR